MQGSDGYVQNSTVENVTLFRNTEVQNNVNFLTFRQIDVQCSRLEICYRCVCLTEVSSSGELGDSLQFYHHVSILYLWKCSIIAAKPGWAVHDGRHSERAFNVPESAAIYSRTVVPRSRVVVHIPRRKFHPVVRNHQKRMSEAEYVVYGTATATHNIAGYVPALVK